MSLASNLVSQMAGCCQKLAGSALFAGTNMAELSSLRTELLECIADRMVAIGTNITSLERFQRNCFEGSLEQHAADIETAVAAMGADLAPPVIWARVYLSAIHLASPSAGLLGGMPHCTGPGPGPGQL